MRRLTADWRVWAAVAGVLVVATVVALIIVVPHGPHGPRGPRGPRGHVKVHPTSVGHHHPSTPHVAPTALSPSTVAEPTVKPRRKRRPVRAVHHPHPHPTHSPSAHPSPTPSPCPTLPVAHICRPV